LPQQSILISGLDGGPIISHIHHSGDVLAGTCADKARPYRDRPEVSDGFGGLDWQIAHLSERPVGCLSWTGVNVNGDESQTLSWRSWRPVTFRTCSNYFACWAVSQRVLFTGWEYLKTIERSGILGSVVYLKLRGDLQLGMHQKGFRDQVVDPAKRGPPRVI